MNINSDGSYEVLGWFRQLTSPQGDYIGSAPCEPREILNPSEFSNLNTQVGGVAKMAYDLGHRGLVGVDNFEVNKQNYEVVPSLTELNCRVPISGTAKIIADKLGAPFWINTNMECHELLLSIDDFQRVFRDHLLVEPRGFETEAKVLPQACRTFISKDGTPMVASSEFKALIVGPDQATCETLFLTLMNTGVIKVQKND